MSFWVDSFWQPGFWAVGFWQEAEAPVDPTRPSVGSPRDRTFIPLRKDALAEIRQRDDVEIAEIVNILFAVGVFDGK